MIEETEETAPTKPRVQDHASFNGNEQSPATACEPTRCPNCDRVRWALLHTGEFT